VKRFGKYRGTVVDNMDPLRRGRVRVSVETLGKGQLNWAEACVPYAGDEVGLFAVPPVGAQVWVEFEDGDTDLPIVSGCFWNPKQAPPGSGLPTSTVLKTGGVTLTLDATPGDGGLTIEVAQPAVSTPMRLSCTSTGIELSIGASKIKMTAASVSVNDGALEVI